jgi:hypothetical protein
MDFDFLFEINVRKINKELETCSLDDLIKKDIKKAWFTLHKDLSVSHKALLKSIVKLNTQDTIFKDYDVFKSYCEELKGELNPTYSLKKSIGEYEEELYTLVVEGFLDKPYTIIISQIQKEYSIFLTVNDSHTFWYAFDTHADSHHTNIYHFKEYFNLRKMAAQILQGTRKENKKYKLYFRSSKDRYYSTPIKD